MTEETINPIDYAKHALGVEVDTIMQGAIVTAHDRADAVKQLESVSEDMHRAITDKITGYSTKVKAGEYDHLYTSAAENAGYKYLEEKYGKVKP